MAGKKQKNGFVDVSHSNLFKVKKEQLKVGADFDAILSKLLSQNKKAMNIFAKY